MAQQEQVPSHAALSEHERNSPYVAGSGAVSELGQPTSTTGDSHGVGAAHSEDRGLHSGGEKPGGYYDTPHPGAQHPLQATQDVNIGHEPFSSSGAPGYGEPDPTHQREGKPGFVGKMKDAFTGQKPGQGTATGHATAGSALPGEEDYAGHATPGAAVPQNAGHGAAERGTHGIGDKIKGLMGGTKQAHSTPGAGEDGWPRPVPPPGMSNPQLSSGVPSAGHYTPKMDPHAGSHGTQYPSSTPAAPDAGHEKLNVSSTPDARHGTPAGHENLNLSSTPGEPYAGHDGKPTPAGRENLNLSNTPGEPYAGHDGKATPAGHEDLNLSNTPGEPYAGHDGKATPAGHEDLNLSNTPGEPYTGHDGNPNLGGVGTPGVPGAGTHNLSSTPAEPHARHDTPTAHNTSGAEYMDSHGNLQHEGPRDDNVKKEGLMSKMLDKLHLGGTKKHNKKPVADTATTASSTY